jgi:hypothetical protein
VLQLARLHVLGAPGLQVPALLLPFGNLL